jgi:hypothetical protein
MLMAGDLTPLYYLTGIGSAIGGGLWAVRNYLNKQKKEWTAEGAKQANLSDKLDANTNAATRNTAAIESLTRELHDMALKTEERLNNHERRLDRIETKGWTSAHDR